MLKQWHLLVNPRPARRRATCILGFFSMDVGHDHPLYALPNFVSALYALQEWRQVYWVDCVVPWQEVPFYPRVQSLEGAVVEDPVARGLVTRIVDDLGLLES